VAPVLASRPKGVGKSMRVSWSAFKKKAGGAMRSGVKKELSSRIGDLEEMGNAIGFKKK